MGSDSIRWGTTFTLYSSGKANVWNNVYLNEKSERVKNAFYEKDKDDKIRNECAE